MQHLQRSYRRPQGTFSAQRIKTLGRMRSGLGTSSPGLHFATTRWQTIALPFGTEEFENDRQATRGAAMNEVWLLLALLFGSFGLGFFVYGRKQQEVVPLICGLVLMVFPYFISNTILLVAIGVVVIVVPYFVRN